MEQSNESILPDEPFRPIESEKLNPATARKAVDSQPDHRNSYQELAPNPVFGDT
jgi:hypothetical protein